MRAEQYLNENNHLETVEHADEGYLRSSEVYAAMEGYAQEVLKSHAIKLEEEFRLKAAYWRAIAGLPEPFSHHYPSLDTLKAKRELNGLSMRDLAKLTGVSAATISRIERGNECDYSNAVKLFTYFDAKSR